MHYLYRITNMINNKLYIGQTINPGKRWSGHKTQAKLDNPAQLISRAIKKYGSDKFQFEVIAQSITQEDADWAEETLISQYNSLASNGRGYNLSLGGESSPKSDQWKRHMSQVMSGQHNPMYGKPSHLRGKKQLPHVIEAMKPTMFGNKPAFNKGKKMAEICDNYQHWNQGNKLPEEERKARRKAVTARYRAKIKAQKELHNAR